MYYVVFIFGLLSFFINDKKVNKRLAFIFFLVILLLAVLRYGVGTDYFIYERLYQSLLDNPIKELLNGIPSQEIGYRLIGSLFRMVKAPYSIFIAAIAFVNLIYVYKLSVEFSENPFLSIFMYYSFYYFVWTYSGLRQGLTLTIGCYYLLKFFNRDRSLLFILIIGILSLIHISVLILIPLYFLSKMKITNKVFFFSIFIALLLILLPMLLPLERILELPIISLGMRYKLVAYLNMDYDFNNLLDFKFIVRYLYLLVLLVYYKFYSNKNDVSKFIVNLYFFSILLYFSLQYSELMAARFSLYGKYLDIIIYANIYSYTKNKFNRYILVTILIFYNLLFFQKELQNMKEPVNLVKGHIEPNIYFFNENITILQKDFGSVVSIFMCKL